MKQPSACTAMTHLRVPNKNGIITLSFAGRGVPSTANLPEGGPQVAPDAGQEPLELPWESDEAVQVFQLFAQCPSRDALQQATLPTSCLVIVDIAADLLPKDEAAISAAPAAHAAAMALAQAGISPRCWSANNGRVAICLPPAPPAAAADMGATAALSLAAVIRDFGLQMPNISAHLQSGDLKKTINNALAIHHYMAAWLPTLEKA